MLEDPQDVQNDPSSSSEPGPAPEPGFDQDSTGDATRPPEAEQPTAEKLPPATELPPAARSPIDYISEIRQNLASEESSKRSRGTGGLLRRITGSLRRVTGPLRNTGGMVQKEEKPAPQASAPETAAEQGPAQQETAAQQEAAEQPEIPDDFLSSRLGGEAPGKTPENWEEPAISSGGIFDFQEFTEPEVPGEPLVPGEPNVPMEQETFGEQDISPTFDLESTLGDEAPINLLDSGAIAAWGRAEEAAQQEAEPDWMREIREEAAQEAAQPGGEEELSGASAGQTASETPGKSSTTQQLRNFLSGILGRPGEKRKPKEEDEFPDEMITGRLGRSLGAEEEQVPDITAGETEAQASIEPGADAALDEQFSLFFGETVPGQSDILNAPAGDEPENFLDTIELNFGQVEEAAPGEATGPYQFYPEDEQLLWGESGQPPAADQSAPETPIAPEELWGEQASPFNYGSDLRREIWGEEIQPDTPPEDPFKPFDDVETPASDAYTAAYLTGEGYQPEETAPAQEDLQNQEDTPVSAQDLRSIALEDYEDYAGWKIDWGDEAQTTATAEAGGAVQEMGLAEAAPEFPAEEVAWPGKDWKTWWAARKPGQKLLLAEAVLAVVAMVIAVPFFIYLIFRGPVKPAAPASANAGAIAAPANFPYPTGLSLPGGWYFALAKSSFTNGQWQPVTSEWLEGTELRRVVALPWNTQTEAVIKSFQAGDTVSLYLSNMDVQRYKVVSVERVPVSNTQIYSDRTSSLAIILYKEKDTSRWVVIARP